jgi:hypothetical protein
LEGLDVRYLEDAAGRQEGEKGQQEVSKTAAYEPVLRRFGIVVRFPEARSESPARARMGEAVDSAGGSSLAITFKGNNHAAKSFRIMASSMGSISSIHSMVNQVVKGVERLLECFICLPDPFTIRPKSKA